MIYSEREMPSNIEFSNLMKNVDDYLNNDLKKTGREEYYSNRSGKLIEEDVFNAMKICANKTPFDGSIFLVSGRTF